MMQRGSPEHSINSSMYFGHHIKKSLLAKGSVLPASSPQVSSQRAGREPRDANEKNKQAFVAARLPQLPRTTVLRDGEARS